MKRVLITGASSGIGLAFSQIFSERGYGPLFLVGRNIHALNSLANTLVASTKVIQCDLSEEQEIDRLIDEVPETDILVNCAGFGLYGLFHQGSWGRHRDMISVNVLALSQLTHHYLAGMLATHNGKILNVASTAGLGFTPYLSDYAATKAFVIQFTKGLAAELLDSGVTVSCLLPGPTMSKFRETAGMRNVTGVNKYHESSPRNVALYGIRLMERGEIWGIPGVLGYLKQAIRMLTPESLLIHIMRLRMKTWAS